MIFSGDTVGGVGVMYGVAVGVGVAVGKRVGVGVAVTRTHATARARSRLISAMPNSRFVLVTHLLAATETAYYVGACSANSNPRFS